MLILKILVSVRLNVGEYQILYQNWVEILQLSSVFKIQFTSTNASFRVFSELIEGGLVMKAGKLQRAGPLFRF